MDFGFSKEQEMLRDSARSLLEKECPSTVVRKLMEDDTGYAPEFWKKMAELGWLGLIVPEAYGGAGLNYIDLVVVLEEMGKVVLPSPFLWTVLFGEAVARAGSDALKQKLLPKVAGGALIGTLAYLEPSGNWDPAAISMSAKKSGQDFVLEGTKLYVNDGHVADYLLVAARTGGEGLDGLTLFAIDRGRAGITVNKLKTMDQTRKLAEIVFSNVKAGAEDVVGEVGKGAKALNEVIDRGKVALSAEMVGGAQKVLDMSVEYAKVREQFGRPIGSFQAIQHKCANMLIDVENARSVAYYAAWAVSNEVSDASLAAATAKAAASDSYRRVAGEGIQVHGGIGFTWEHDMHLYFKRAKSTEFTFGDATYNRELVAQLFGL
ncbi:MAG TPA: acyl-CoA dehydrogenase family protein [Candidatus Binataceae bacterium]|nr:acyl-CoA dehydrogenase family protein [Candidatus Binataceae bacterium]